MYFIYSCCCFPWSHVHEGGGRADAECAEQELLLLRGVDPQQRQDRRLRHPPKVFNHLL